MWRFRDYPGETGHGERVGCVEGGEAKDSIGQQRLIARTEKVTFSIRGRHRKLTCV